MFHQKCLWIAIFISNLNNVDTLNKLNLFNGPKVSQLNKYIDNISKLMELWKLCTVYKSLSTMYGEIVGHKSVEAYISF